MASLISWSARYPYQSYHHITPQRPEQPSLCKKSKGQKIKSSVQEPQQEELSTETDRSTSKNPSKEELGRPIGRSPREEEIGNVDMLDWFSPIGTMKETRNTQITSDKTFVRHVLFSGSLPCWYLLRSRAAEKPGSQIDWINNRKPQLQEGNKKRSGNIYVKGGKKKRILGARHTVAAGIERKRDCQ